MYFMMRINYIYNSKINEEAVLYSNRVVQIIVVSLHNNDTNFCRWSLQNNAPVQILDWWRMRQYDPFSVRFK